MAITDGELVGLWNRRCRRWVEVLEAVRSEQADVLGREVGPIQWIGSPAFGPWTWLGYFWTSEPFWFGYGFDGRQLRLVIEIDGRAPAAKSWLLLRRQLPAVWKFSRSENYFRLWGDAELMAAPARSQVAWLRSRGREIHEYSVSQ